MRSLVFLTFVYISILSCVNAQSILKYGPDTIQPFFSVNSDSLYTQEFAYAQEYENIYKNEGIKRLITNDLILNLEDGDTVILRSKIQICSSCNDPESEFVRYSYLDFDSVLNSYYVGVGYYEWSNSILINKTNGTTTNLLNNYILSPGNNYLLTYNWDFAYGGRLLELCSSVNGSITSLLKIDVDEDRINLKEPNGYSNNDSKWILKWIAKDQFSIFFLNSENKEIPYLTLKLDKKGNWEKRYF